MRWTSSSASKRECTVTVSGVPEERVCPHRGQDGCQRALNRAEAIDVLKKFHQLGIGLDQESARGFVGSPMLFAIFAEEVGKVWPRPVDALRHGYIARHLRARGLGRSEVPAVRGSRQRSSSGASLKQSPSRL